MILSWLICYIPGLSRCFVTRSGYATDDDKEGPLSTPPSQDQCWQTLVDINSETQFRYSLGQGSTLEDQKNRMHDAIYALTKHHGMTLTAIHREMRDKRLSMVWLYPLLHPGAMDPECATVCRDAVTREARSYSLGMFLGPESEYILIRQAATRGSSYSVSLEECGFLELK